MRSVTIVLTGLMLVLGSGAAWAATGLHAGDTLAVSANQETALPDNSDVPAPSASQTDPGSGFDDDVEDLPGKSIPVWDYAVNPRFTIDLKCRPVNTDQSELDLVSNVLDLEKITQNFMVGFRYKF